MPSRPVVAAEAEEFAREWIAAWNSHDLDATLPLRRRRRIRLAVREAVEVMELGGDGLVTRVTAHYTEPSA